MENNELTIKDKKTILKKLEDDVFTNNLYKIYRNAMKHTNGGVLIIRVNKISPQFIPAKGITNMIMKQTALSNKSDYEIFKDYLIQIVEGSIIYDISIEEVLEEENEIAKS